MIVFIYSSSLIRERPECGTNQAGIVSGDVTDIGDAVLKRLIQFSAAHPDMRDMTRRGGTVQAQYVPGGIGLAHDGLAKLGAATIGVSGLHKENGFDSGLHIVDSQLIEYG